ncbi:hypothetical protein CYMTET_12847 [Cymbomonas tetramitiformis]|uniref:Uncharacterized protein n=1 Tax=Cymbomonas tetramitiformis TaxID=36881 RepID=A0AAE0GJ86_9CHLO|nr:hypothetical protein CYMTET_12847 [Cymbomonas tetramitiformis]
MPAERPISAIKPGTSLNTELVKAHAGQFSCDAVCVFTYTGRGLPNITALHQCVNLVELNLSDNLVSKIEGIETLSKLKKLVLTNNKITRVENLGSLESLEHLLIQGNQITSLEALNLPLLTQLPKLRSLYLKNVDGSQPNPVCKEKDYKQTILTALPDLRNLDGERMSFPVSVLVVLT